MPEGRFISKTIAHSEQLGAVPLEADYLFTRCIPHLDRDGRMPGNPALVKSIACPLRPEIEAGSIPDLLRTLVGAGLVKWYEADGRQVLEFPGFGRHQKGMKYDREAPSRFPAYRSPASPDPIRTRSGPDPDEVRLSEVEVKSSEVKSPSIHPSSRADAREEAAPPLVEDVERFIDHTIVLANRGMKDNPNVGLHTPIELCHGKSRQAVADWLAEGLSREAVEAAVYDSAKRYKPTSSRKRISSLTYFDGAVRDEQNRIDANQVEVPGGNHVGSKRGGTSAREPPGRRTPQQYSYPKPTEGKVQWKR